MPTILTFVPNLLFGVPVSNLVRGAGARAQACATPDAVRAALVAPDDLAGVVVDLSNPAWEPVIQAAAAAGVPVFAFGPHLDSVRLKAARQAGARRVVANSAMAQELPKWVQRQLAPAPVPTLEEDLPDDHPGH
jgi:hypothetical protein